MNQNKQGVGLLGGSNYVQLTKASLVSKEVFIPSQVIKVCNLDCQGVL
jgi:hypothetical protein